MKIISAIDDPAVIRKILDLADRCPDSGPAPFTAS
jgi:hypothetical protein